MGSFKQKLDLSKKKKQQQIKENIIMIYFKALLFGCKIEVTGMLDTLDSLEY